VLNLSDDEREAFRVALRARAITLEAALGRAISSDGSTELAEVLARDKSFDEVARALADGFAQALNLELVPGELSPDEQARADVLRTEKYAAEGWTFQI